MCGIDLLMKEHENIVAFTMHLRRTCCAVVEGADIDVQEFMECVDFARNYADKYHHGKEEQILFRFMLDNADPVAEKMVRSGMLVEHDFGRYHIRELENALKQYADTPTVEGKLDIVAHAAGYVDLLQRHIMKEDTVCYTYALRTLSEECKKQIDEQTREFEKKADQEGIQKKYLAWLEKRERAVIQNGCNSK